MKNKFVFVMGIVFPLFVLFAPFKSIAIKETHGVLNYFVFAKYKDSLQKISLQSESELKYSIISDSTSFKKQQLLFSPQLKKKIISSVMAFPFPLGFMGAHRVMLGTKPYVPLVYIATFGGCFGIIPLIDFLVISFSKNIEQYENNPNVFMWIK